MSRHVLIDRPDCYVVLGFDHMLQSFFGQRFRSRADGEGAGNAVAGWPTSSGLGRRRPVRTYAERDEDLRLLMQWARAKVGPELAKRPDVDGHIESLRAILRFEWEEGEDRESPSVPACLRGPRP